MGTSITGRLALLVAIGLAAGCSPGGGFQNPFRANSDDPPADTSVASATSVRLIDRDVEAPDVFQVTDAALWDGRPSLGGVWVASPDAVDPERVIMRNPANGKFVIGALFKRERENPGPTLQISSDAAAALGLLAGQPGRINVTALRREEAPAQPDAARPLLDTAETVASENSAAPVAASPAQTAAPAVVISTTVAAAPQTGAANTVAANTVATSPSLAGGGSLIQVGIFSVESNAKRAVSTLTAAGVSAMMRTETSNGKTYWNVAARGDAGALAKVKAAGFKDAYFTKG